MIFGYPYKAISSYMRSSRTLENKLFLLEMGKEEWVINNSYCQYYFRNKWRNIKLEKCK